MTFVVLLVLMVLVLVLQSQISQVNRKINELARRIGSKVEDGPPNE
jgi:cell division protein FtsL